MSFASDKQKVHYEAIHDAYEAHYYDPTSADFRRRFIYDPLLEGIDLNGKLIADLASGSGMNSTMLLERFPNADVVGFDISAAACGAYLERTGREAHELDLTKGDDPGIRADAAIIIGGLHHCVSDLRATLQTVAHIVKPGGSFLMMEPNKQYLLEAARKLWYRADKYFEADTEEALAHDDIAAIGAEWFEPVKHTFLGGPAYFLILNSLLFRIPVAAKPALAPPLFRLEGLYNKLPGRLWYPYFVARWRRR